MDNDCNMLSIDSSMCAGFPTWLALLTAFIFPWSRSQADAIQAFRRTFTAHERDSTPSSPKAFVMLTSYFGVCVVRCQVVQLTVAH